MRVPRPVLMLAVLVAIVLVAAGCNGSTGPTPSATGSSASATASPSSGASGSPATPGPTLPSAEPTPEPTESPSDSPTTDLAEACSGNDANRDFYVAVAAAVEWPVYCPVLPSGWFVDAGEYRLAAGGRMEISYRGPGGASLELREGAFCAGQDPCDLPDGADAGAADFGDREGILVGLDDGGWAVVVDRGVPISWLATFRGLDESTVRELAAAFAIVAG